MAEGDGLEDDVAERGGFDRSGDDGATSGVGCELVQQFVLAATTDDVKHLSFQAGDFFDLTQGAVVLQGEAFQDTAGDGSGSDGFWLFRFAAKRGDLGGHAAGGDEARVGEVDDRGERRGISGEFGEGAVVDVVAFGGPLAAAFLDHPQADDVFQKTHGAAVAEFIGEIMRAAEIGEHGAIEFDAEQGPGAGAEVGPVLAASGDSSDGGTGVVGTGGDDLEIF